MTMIHPLGHLTHVHAASSGNSGNSGNSGTGNSPAAGGATGTGGLADSLPANMQITQAGFLKLISTQMSSQNPLNPTDPTQFLAQVEGLSEVSSLQSLQTTMAGLASGLQASQVISGTSLLGHSVLAAGTTANIAAGGSVSGAVSAPSGTSALAVSVTNASGVLVDAFAVAPQTSGYTPFTWNGTTSQGAAAPAGQYTIQVTAAAGNTTQSLNPYLYSKVTSVTLDPTTQALTLNTNNGSVPLSSVINIQ
jgi:flagellar basal-body rod modification protein FlgD